MKILTTPSLSHYIYWLPTIQTNLELKGKSLLTNLYMEEENKSYIGNVLNISFYFLCFSYGVLVWWDLEMIINHKTNEHTDQQK